MGMMTVEEARRIYAAAFRAEKDGDMYDAGLRAVVQEAERRGREAERERIAAGLSAHGWCTQRIAEALDVLGPTTPEPKR